MTTTTILPNGDKGVIGSPAHRLLARMANTVTGYTPAGVGATVTQLRSLERKGYAKCLRTGPVGATVQGAHLTPRGESYVEMLNRAEAHEKMLETLR
jgi:hypothetical protein